MFISLVFDIESQPNNFKVTFCLTDSRSISWVLHVLGLVENGNNRWVARSLCPILRKICRKILLNSILEYTSFLLLFCIIYQKNEIKYLHNLLMIQPSTCSHHLQNSDLIVYPLYIFYSENCRDWVSPTAHCTFTESP